MERERATEPSLLKESVRFSRDQKADHPDHPHAQQKGKDRAKKPGGLNKSLGRITPSSESRAGGGESPARGPDSEKDGSGGQKRAERVKGKSLLPLAAPERAQSARHPASGAGKACEPPKRTQQGRRSQSPKKRAHNKCEEQNEEHEDPRPLLLPSPALGVVRSLHLCFCDPSVQLSRIRFPRSFPKGRCPACACIPRPQTSARESGPGRLSMAQDGHSGQESAIAPDLKF